MEQQRKFNIWLGRGSIGAGPLLLAIRTHRIILWPGGGYSLKIIAHCTPNNEKLEHSSSAGQNYGENLCMRSQTPLQCVQDWYDEIADYDFEKPQFAMSTGHFTALVWKNAKKMGIGQAKDKKGYYWVVARYYPPVNVNGQFEENVLPPIKG